MNRLPVLIVCLAILASTGGCLAKSTAGAAAGRSGESLEQQVARHDSQIQKILSQVGQVEMVLPGQAEMWSQIQTMRQEMNSAQGRLEDLSAQISGEGSGELARLKDKVARMEALLRQIASQLAISAGSLDAQIPAPGIPEPLTQAPPLAPSANQDTATTLYEAGVDAFGKGRYQDAIVSFRDFIASFPKHELAGNANFWAGESYFQIKDYPRAALAYQEVIAKFPGSAKVQSAMLKQGISLYHAGKKDVARQRLNELIKKYPKSPESGRAKTFLKQNK
ncbi:MAG: tol-pal system protein YbgF [Deltaproteobacteria bacterium]|jgi:tol-pal system protein YbgF|nr:tol-pal system protein YbgF [Deltaproteobacteria bacterium]